MMNPATGPPNSSRLMKNSEISSPTQRMTGPMTRIVAKPVAITANSGVNSMSSTVGIRLRSHFSTTARNHTANRTGSTVPW